MDDKIIVTNSAALTAKYGAAGVAKIKKAVQALIAADAKRGIKTRLVYLDNAAAMKSFKGRAVNDPRRPAAEQGSHRRDLSGDGSGIFDDPRRTRCGAASGHEEPGLRPARMIPTSGPGAICPMPAISPTRATSRPSKGRPASSDGCRI